MKTQNLTPTSPSYDFISDDFTIAFLVAMGSSDFLLPTITGGYVACSDEYATAYFGDDVIARAHTHGQWYCRLNETIENLNDQEKSILNFLNTIDPVQLLRLYQKNMLNPIISSLIGKTMEKTRRGGLVNGSFYVYTLEYLKNDIKQRTETGTVKEFMKKNSIENEELDSFEKICETLKRNLSRLMEEKYYMTETCEKYIEDGKYVANIEIMKIGEWLRTHQEEAEKTDDIQVELK